MYVRACVRACMCVFKISINLFVVFVCVHCVVCVRCLTQYNQNAHRFIVVNLIAALGKILYIHINNNFFKQLYV